MTYLVDVDLLVKRLLGALLPDVTALPEIDVDELDPDDGAPLVIFSSGTPTAVANGPLRLAQLVPVSVTVIDAQRDGRSALANGKATVDDVTRAFVEDFPRSKVAGVGSVNAVEPTAVPSRTSSSTLAGKDFVQFDGVFTLVVRPV